MYRTRWQLRFKDEQDCTVLAEIMVNYSFSGSPVELQPADHSLIIQEDDSIDYQPIRKATGYIRVMVDSANDSLDWLPYDEQHEHVIRITRTSKDASGSYVSEVLFVGVLDYEVCEFECFNYPQEVQCNFHDLLTHICQFHFDAVETLPLAGIIKKAFTRRGFEQFLPERYKYSCYDSSVLGPMSTIFEKDAWYKYEKDKDGVDRKKLQLQEETWGEALENIAKYIRMTFSFCGDTLYLTSRDFGNHGLLDKTDFNLVASGQNPRTTSFVSQPAVYKDLVDEMRVWGNGHKMSMHNIINDSFDNIMSMYGVDQYGNARRVIYTPKYKSTQSADYVWSKADPVLNRPRILRVFGLNRWYDVTNIFAAISSYNATVKATPFDKTVAVKHGGRLYRPVSRKYDLSDGRTEVVMIEVNATTYNFQQEYEDEQKQKYKEAINEQIDTWPMLYSPDMETLYWDGYTGATGLYPYGAPSSLMVYLGSDDGVIWVSGRAVEPTEVIFTNSYLGRFYATKKTISGNVFYVVEDFWSILENYHDDIIGTLETPFDLHVNFTTPNGQLVGTGAIPVTPIVRIVKNGDMPVSALPTSLEWGMDNPAYRSSEYRVWKRIMHYNRSSILTILTGVDYEGKFYAADRIVVHNANAIAENDFELAINEYGEAQFEITQAAKMDNSETPPGVTPKVYDHYWSIQGYAEYNTQEGLKQVPFEIFITFNPQP